MLHFTPNARVLIPASTAWEFGVDDFCIEAIVTLDEISGYRCLASLGYSDDPNGIALYLQDGRCHPWRTGQSLGSGGPTVGVGDKVHVAISRVNGQLYSSLGGVTFPHSSHGSSLFGSDTCILRLGGNSGGNSWLDGRLHAVRIRLGEGYAANFSPPESLDPTAGTVALYDCDPDPAHPNQLRDLVGSNHSSSLGGATFDTGGGGATPDELFVIQVGAGSGVSGGLFPKVGIVIDTDGAGHGLRHGVSVLCPSDSCGHFHVITDDGRDADFGFNGLTDQWEFVLDGDLKLAIGRNGIVLT